MSRNLAILCGLVAKSCLTLATLLTVVPQVPLSMGFPRQGYWSGLPFPSPRDLPDPGIKLRSPALQADSSPTESSGRPISQSQRNEHNKNKTDNFAAIQ